MLFKPKFDPSAAELASALWFIFDNGRLLIKIKNDICSIPDTSDLAIYKSAIFHEQYLGTLDDRPCFAAEFNGNLLADTELAFKDLRGLFGMLEEDLIWIAGRANQLVNWSQTHRHCGRCGQLTEDKIDERAKTCPECGLVNYPRLSPAIIVAVLKMIESCWAAINALNCRFTVLWPALWSREKPWKNVLGGKSAKRSI